jgi:hypothetical protein
VCPPAEGVSVAPAYDPCGRSLTWQQRPTTPYRQPPRSRCSSSERRGVEGARHAMLRQSMAAAGRCALQLADANCSTPARSVFTLATCLGWLSAGRGPGKGLMLPALSGCPAQRWSQITDSRFCCILHLYFAAMVSTWDTLAPLSLWGHLWVSLVGFVLYSTVGLDRLPGGLQQVLHTVRVS